MKWCPFTRNLINDGRSLVPATESGFNRVVNPAGTTGMSINTKISPCIREACQVWNGHGCGLAAPVGTKNLLDMVTAELIRQANERAASETETEADLASDGTADTTTGT